MKGMQTFIMGIIIVSVTLVIGIYIVSSIQTSLLTDAGVSTAASNAAGEVVTSLGSGTPWITILVVVGFAVIVLGMLTSGFKNSDSGGPVY